MNVGISKDTLSQVKWDYTQCVISIRLWYITYYYAWCDFKQSIKKQRKLHINRVMSNLFEYKWFIASDLTNE